ncbi:MAG: cytochrome b5-like heme/steroid binding domain-containing protein [Patescibacteria group bacterium]
MNNKLITLLIGVILVASVGGLVLWQKNTKSTAQTSDTATTQNTETPAQTPEVQTQPSGITGADVAKHASRNDCWSTINGNVYDLTSWIPNHPGGEQAILQLCGKDGSAKFNGQHGGAAKQAGILAGFKIGILVQ